ncbi:hypothetical protein ZHAS_00011141 [Anopheles sinensis]|uniref:Uncharacterized protein n=1 Tax=Anopheles sinensis TaxID=74873 RepID=A0A084VZF3_ANOSI|nr:hypothetical protein ZHAS_00011141 [Anopheles sinensis]
MGMSEPKLKTDKDGIPIDDPSIRGWSRYFNNCTIRGRANVAKATLALMAVGTVYYRYFRPKGSAISETDASVAKA